MTSSVASRPVSWSFRCKGDDDENYKIDDWEWLGEVTAQTWAEARALARIELTRMGYVNAEAECERSGE